MKKTLNTTDIVSELRGGSVFFQDPTPPLLKPETSQEVENVDKSTNQQVDKLTSKQVDKPTSTQVDKSTSGQINKSTKRFTTYLTEDSIKSMKRLALEDNKK